MTSEYIYSAVTKAMGSTPKSCSHCFLSMVAVYIIGLFSEVRYYLLAQEPRSYASHHWKDNARDLRLVRHVCLVESCLFPVMEMCLYYYLVCIVVANSAPIFPSSFLRNLKRATQR